MTVNSEASRGATLCQDKCENGLPCMSRSGGPRPPLTVTMRAPLVFISERMKPSNMLFVSQQRGALQAALHIRFPVNPCKRGGKNAKMCKKGPSNGEICRKYRENNRE